MERILGVLGGMGPLATVDFLSKIIQSTPANSDQDHIPIIAASLPQIPDRTDAILLSGESPLDAMTVGIRRLEVSGAGAIAIPCNTAHHWYEPLQRSTKLPILHIADSVVAHMKASGIEPGCRVGILASSGTLKVGIYETRLQAAGLAYVEPEAKIQETLIMSGIWDIKTGDLQRGAKKIISAMEYLQDCGAKKIILACSEVPVGIDFANYTSPALIDATDVLAMACVNWAKGRDQTIRMVG